MEGKENIEKKKRKKNKEKNKFRINKLFLYVILNLFYLVYLFKIKII